MRRLVLGLFIALLLAGGLAAQSDDLTVSLTFTAKQAANLKAMLDARRAPSPMPDVIYDVVIPRPATVEDVTAWVTATCTDRIRGEIQQYIESETRTLDLSQIPAEARPQLKPLMDKLKTMTPAQIEALVAKIVGG